MALIPGNLDIQRFDFQNGGLVAIGTLTGTLTDSLGNSQNVTQSVILPVTNISATCDILHLELGPLDLDLLGLVVHLDKVVLDITAEQGPGNLLGNLLCALTRLLDSNGSLNAIAQLLTKIIDLLR